MTSNQSWSVSRHEDGEQLAITNPAGLEYEIGGQDIENPLVRSLLNDVLDGILALQNENAALRERVAMLESAAAEEWPGFKPTHWMPLPGKQNQTCVAVVDFAVAGG